VRCPAESEPQRRGGAERSSEDSTGFVREFFRPFGGVTFDDRATIPLQRGARAVRPWGGCGFGNEPTPAPPLQGEDSQGNALFQMFSVFIFALLAPWRFASSD
jgi:hypothetical protein